MDDNVKEPMVTKVVVGSQAKILVSVDYGLMPAQRANQYGQQIKDKIKEAFPDNPVIVLPSTVQITIVDEVDNI
jgi:hypothetical protein